MNRQSSSIAHGRGSTSQTFETISSNGDLLLHIPDTKRRTTISYCVSSTVLRKASPYFDNLLDPNKFSEGIEVKSRFADLLQRYGDMASVPLVELPAVKISDVGQYPKVMMSDAVVTHFLKILHDPLTPYITVPSTVFLALLAIVADRFAATEHLAKYIRQQGWLEIPSDVKAIKQNLGSPGKEPYCRQRVLIGLLLGFDDWVCRYSNILVLSGSEKWVTGDVHSDSYADALWWNLPSGIEGTVCGLLLPDSALTVPVEELLCRREYLLSTISSLQSHFFSLYASKQRQCKLGYDSSPQCDSFQLGEMIRFFTRKSTMTLQSRIIDYEYSQPYAGPIDELLSNLRECPEYQIDKNHMHCGLRTKFIPAIDYIQSLSKEAGICLQCWKEDQREHGWLETPVVGTWRFKPTFGRRRSRGACKIDHRAAKAMFTAQLRDWTPVP
ncbi:hypothetical protein MMC06_001362 [Schaereria dolodes]|nr:hypothetical protein [Schaereria dolodes]